MLKTIREFTEFGLITKWEDGRFLERYTVTENGVYSNLADTTWSLEQLSKLGLEVGDVVVVGATTHNEDGDTGILFIIAQADLERDLDKEEAWDTDKLNGIDREPDYGVDTVDLENVVDAEELEYVANWIQNNCKHFIVEQF
jgi:hypothetical protein